MYMTTSFRRSFLAFARLMLGVLLLAQFAHFTQACVMPGSNPVAAFTQEAIGDGCNMQGMSSKAGCLAQCLQDDQVTKNPDATPMFSAFDIPLVIIHSVYPSQNPAATTGRYFGGPLRLAALPPFLRFSRLLN